MKIIENQNLSKKSTLGVGSIARFYSEVSTKEELLEVFEFAKKNKLGILPIGLGSNIFFQNEITDKLVLKIKISGGDVVVKTDKIKKGCDSILDLTEKKQTNLCFKSYGKKIQVGVNGKTVEPMEGVLDYKSVGEKKDSSLSVYLTGSAGDLLSSLINRAQKEGGDLTGLSGFPSTLGGAIVGNAGLLGNEIKDFLVAAILFDLKKGEFVEWKNEDFKFSYRNSALKSGELVGRFIIIEALFGVKKGKSPEDLKEKLSEILKIRAVKQPAGKSLGSFFKNPEGDFAGRLIDEVGLKGHKIGGAFFSEKHANFLMTDGEVSTENVTELKNLAKEKVKKQFGIELEEEVLIY